MGNKAILMSIQPKWVVKILNGEKTIEVRKRFPKDYVGWVYIYCTKGKEILYKAKANINGNTMIYLGDKEGNPDTRCYDNQELNGKVVARFWCDNVHDIEVEENDSNGNYSDTYIYCDIPDLEDQSCLEFDDIVEYLWSYHKWGGKGYVIHITRLEIFDKPMLLTMFRKVGFRKFLNDSKPNRMSLFETLKKYSITKAPQSWQYIEGE